MLKDDKALLAKVNRRLKKIGKQYRGTVNVRHIVTVLRDDIGVEAISKTVTRPLTGVMVAIHYGCHLLKPRHFMQVDDPDDPRVMDLLIRATGADTCRHKEWYLCCGKACRNDDLKKQMTGTVLDSIRDMKADCMGMICPSCFSSFDLGQILLKRQHKAETGKELPDVPPVYYFQLLGLAQGFTPEQMGFNQHKVKPEALLSKIGVTA